MVDLPTPLPSSGSGAGASATLVELLERRARAEPEREAFRFADVGVSFGELWQGVDRVAAGLLALGLLRAERVVLALPNGIEFFGVFYGIQRAGGIAVPLFPGSGIDRVLQIAGHCEARTVVLPRSLEAGTLDRCRDRAAAESVRVLLAEEILHPAEVPDPLQLPAIAPDDVAYIQYTSGSTGDSKGVQLSHANLLVNARQMIAGMEITAEDVFVSWLPVYHDMGLVLMTIVPFYLGARLVLLPAELTNIRRWIAEIENHRGTFTAAPDFAYRLCLRYMQSRRKHDLSSLRVALDAAEPVRRDTIADFEKAFGLENVMTAGYGLAEATVGVSMSKPGNKVKVDANGAVSVGKAFPEVEISILDSNGSGDPCPPGEPGEILVRSPANTHGYLDNPSANDGLFHDGLLRTGDIGYLDAEGDLYVIGRRKSIIIQAGRNIAPREVEEIVDALPFVRYAAAVGIDRGGLEGEQVYIFAEQRERSVQPQEECERRSIAIVRAVHAHLGLRPGRVYLVAPRAIPRTHNGKIRYAELAERYRNGGLRERGALLFPSW